MKEYTFNDNGVCTNPDVTQSQERHGIIPFWEVKTAKGNDGWVYGYSWYASDSGASSPCAKCNETFETQRAAIDACARKLLKEKAILDKKGLKELIFDNRQLSLFGDD